MPRGPGKKSNYNLDYSRFNGVDDARHADAEEEVGDDSQQASGGMDAEMAQMLRQMPPELQEAYRLMSIANSTGDEKAKQRANELAIKAVEKGGPEVRKNFIQEVAKHLPEDSGLDVEALGMDLNGMDDSMPENLSEKSAILTSKIDKMKAEMEAGKAATRLQMENLQKQQEELESLSSPEDFMKFLSKQGMTEEDMHKMLTADQDHMEAMVGKMMNKATDVGSMSSKLKMADAAAKEASELHSRLLGTGTAATEDAPKKVTRVIRKQEEETQVPMHRIQYQKDADGRFASVELSVDLPGVTDMSSIALDVAEKHIRLNTVAPAPRFLVNAGPFPVLIAPSEARAKFSKKRQQLSVCVPAKSS
eukprot:TRINITY_DN91761_c0_g1_i1.p1 TRINITY_DN91761_c0_g1~~TRINITY_DN91761_c0_g1_i1.p1  ORF type:complete len:363 (-),score=109.82 TRINITY_DN91761_c0_g1_i1:305-1393(-)